MDNITTFDQSGPADYTHALDAGSAALENVAMGAGAIKR